MNRLHAARGATKGPPRVRGSAPRSPWPRALARPHRCVQIRNGPAPRRGSCGSASPPATPRTTAPRFEDAAAAVRQGGGALIEARLRRAALRNRFHQRHLESREAPMRQRGWPRPCRRRRWRCPSCRYRTRASMASGVFSSAASAPPDRARSPALRPRCGCRCSRIPWVRGEGRI